MTYNCWHSHVFCSEARLCLLAETMVWTIEGEEAWRVGLVDMLEMC